MPPPVSGWLRFDDAWHDGGFLFGRYTMKEIPLTQGRFTIVDDEDFEWANQWKWYLNTSGYAVRVDYHQQKRTIYLSRMICHTPIEMETDHINGNRLDNREINLRICTRTQNRQNRIIHKNNSSGYKGVTFDKRKRKWCAQIKCSKHIHLGYFDCLKDAARAYDLAAKKYFGEFARLNFQFIDSPKDGDVTYVIT